LAGITWHSYDVIEKYKEYKGTWPFNPRPALVTLIILQSFLIVSFIFGTVGTRKKNRNCYFWACLILLADAVIIGIFGIVAIRGSRTDFENKLLQSLRAFNNGNKKGNEENVDMIYSFQRDVSIRTF
jgi:hypothetical protein